MLIKFLNHRLTSLIAFSKCSATFQPAFDLANQMELLNDKREFKKVLQLFDEYRENNTETRPSNKIIT